MELKTYMVVGPKFVFEKSNLKFCIIFNIISFANAQGSVKIRLTYSKILLLIDYFGRRVRNVFKNKFISNAFF